MDKAFWLGVAAYLVPTFPLGYFWHLKTFADRYEALGMYRDDVIIPLGFLSMLLQALVFSWAYPRLFSTAADDVWKSAFQCFVVFGVLAVSFVVLPVAAKYRTNSVAGFMILETVFTAIQFAVVSPLMALAHHQPG
ncbi:hypothetical protein [Ciceribacter sp. L1K22]|uniref:hypothetical protein n=1 Tax=Ciceribacter sp. L1K22 TaxID=2820275 RepID=UPI001ABE31B1|nr:hypothetical protein [Ciceribacter sp. L1K22]MBO3759365.1 hypothetical protein [Ciceribacter sp. L1K22]